MKKIFSSILCLLMVLLQLQIPVQALELPGTITISDITGSLPNPKDNDLSFSNSVSYLNIFENNKNIKDKSHSLNSEKNAMKDLETCKSTLSFLISGEE